MFNELKQNHSAEGAELLKAEEEVSKLESSRTSLKYTLEKDD